MMDAKTLTALRQSIKKWERNAVAESPARFAIRSEDCPLCRMFAASGCRGCPVSAATGRDLCDGTPYRAAADARALWSADPIYPPRREKAHAAARAEAEFLRSLLPEEEATP